MLDAALCALGVDFIMLLFKPNAPTVTGDALTVTGNAADATLRLTKVKVSAIILAAHASRAGGF
jgi:hypothetical protein